MDLELRLSLGAEDTLADFPEGQARFSPTDQDTQSHPAFLDLFQRVVDGLPEQIALVDEKWHIIAVNEAWTAAAKVYGYELAPGADYLGFCEARGREGHKPTRIAAAGIRAMDENREQSFRFIYEGSGAWEGKAFQLCINRLEIAGHSYATVTRYDVTELVNLRHMREDFASSMIEGQGIERRRIAREVHDSTMQLLACLGLSLGQLKRAKRSKATAEIVSEMEEMLGEAQRELRTLAYLAHPPQLRDLGLVEAIRQLADGFGRRTGLKITVEAENSVNVCQNTQLAIYRAVQEALSNVHRHAGATEAFIGLHARRSTLHVVIADNGRGMPDDLHLGVGLASIRERVAELGGRLSIRRGEPGLVLVASIPLRAALRAVGGMACRGGPILSNVATVHGDSGPDTLLTS
ncbi:sensor histidine kinase [Sphingomonas sp. HDW15A]|uniref:sensor histidine kinase n=1 Tax=Sphingomonas sp. HDW15A TaxID=2714942 RepID=UPI00140B73B0|nr:sensor histidine kinase [Sphingomonas sp. HDW15A]QIK95971.1 sensor histidine kinase [Sphingomonas sp. HDW15A]